MSDPPKAHEIIGASIETQRLDEPPPEPTATADLRNILGFVLLVAVLALIGWWMSQDPGQDLRVVESRQVLEEGSAALDLLPGTSADQLVIVDERVKLDLSELRAAEIAWLDAGNPPRSLPPCPASDPGRKLEPWGGPCHQEWLAATKWDLPKSSPCRYQVFAAPPDDFRIVAECDADGDGQFETWVADRSTVPREVKLNVR